jgi:3-oxoacyl-[acyl-carrier-protein] synthase II
MRRRVVVTGIGVISPIGVGVDAFWQAALAGTSAWGPIPGHWRDYYQPNSTIWAPLPPLDFAALGITRIESNQLDKAQQIALACARQALDGAGIRYELKDEKKNTWTPPDLDANDASVFIGAGFGGGTTA